MAEDKVSKSLTISRRNLSYPHAGPTSSKRVTYRVMVFPGSRLLTKYCGPTGPLPIQLYSNIHPKGEIRHPCVTLQPWIDRMCSSAGPVKWEPSKQAKRGQVYRKFSTRGAAAANILAGRLKIGRDVYGLDSTATPCS
jgi:hypothetical protein